VTYPTLTSPCKIFITQGYS